MKSRYLRSLALAAGAIAFSAGPAVAASWSQVQCEADGGTFVKNGSDCSCVYPEQTSKPGNTPDGYDGGAQTTTQDTSTGNGNLTNKQTTSTTCEGHKCR